ncbi:hypothetical protein PIB30_044734 [Stylosanthes scabra]|uniref:RNA methyltransferase n=1 Tax=Stylosanthes scabra TaxID=79078 RepID=A0ABU6XDU4_9FABA|nr:hypothetical protein [Stylosanthes scabra]
MAGRERDIDLNQLPFQDSSESDTENDSDSDSGTESESETESEKEEEPVIRSRQYGNFRGYYNKRNHGDPDKDPRLQFLRKEWFEDKECLDIGCNEGTLIISIAKMFRCESILAVDIDPELVEKANENLKNAEADKMEIDESSSSERKNLIDVITFKQENFMESQHPELYHTVTCFSVTQWIHLNFGDEGLIKFFYKLWELLRPGGVLILEPQAWKSYVIKHNVSPVTTEKYHKVTVRPKSFQEILLNRIGFRSVEHINPIWLKAKRRYNRPILVFKK